MTGFDGGLIPWDKRSSCHLKKRNTTKWKKRTIVDRDVKSENTCNIVDTVFPCLLQGENHICHRTGVLAGACQIYRSRSRSARSAGNQHTHRRLRKYGKNVGKSYNRSQKISCQEQSSPQQQSNRASPRTNRRCFESQKDAHRFHQQKTHGCWPFRQWCVILVPHWYHVVW